MDPTHLFGPRGRLFVTGIGTGVGKTVASAVLCRATGADYWKPVQCGDLDRSDSWYVSPAVAAGGGKVLPEAYRFVTPASPDAAAAVEGATIDPARLGDVPAGAGRRVVVEGAGGLMVPLAPGVVFADVVRALGARLVIVVDPYLGSINHTLLTIAAARSRGLDLAGLVMNGDPPPATEASIVSHGGVPVTARVPRMTGPTESEMEAAAAGVFRTG